MCFEPLTSPRHASLPPFLLSALFRGDRTDWFSLFVLHQNRKQYGAKNFVQEKDIPGWLDFVVWGHEHECAIGPTPNTEAGGNTVISQPGSSVATNLSEGESIRKHCMILDILEDNYRVTQLEIESVRPFVFEHVRMGARGRCSAAWALFAARLPLVLVSASRCWTSPASDARMKALWDNGPPGCARVTGPRWTTNPPWAGTECTHRRPR